MQVDDEITSDPSTVAETLNKFYSSITSKIRSKIPFSRHHFSKWLNNPKHRSYFIQPTTPDEVSKILNSFKKTKASGPNSISIRILHLVLPRISEILAQLVNLSFSSCIFPSKLKVAMVIPVFKNKGSPLDAENYRPISLLSNIDKLYQKLTQIRLVNFLEQSEVIYSLQFGFRSNYSTTTACLICSEQFIKAVVVE